MGDLWDAVPGGEVLKVAVGICVAIGLVWRFYRRKVLPAAEAIVRIDRAVPVLMSIATEFSPNSGTSLHDRIVRADTATAEIADRIAGLQDIVENVESTIESQERLTIRLIVAMANLAQRIGYPEIIADLPSHLEEKETDT